MLEGIKTYSKRIMYLKVGDICCCGKIKETLCISARDFVTAKFA